MNWEQLEHLYHQACDLPESERATFLDRACAGDPEARRELIAMLRDDGPTTDFIHGMVARETRSVLTGSDLRPGLSCGRYELIRELGRGGMGEVYLARRADAQFDKLVAIKIVRHGIHIPELHSRFRRERQILARLEHPNIARLLDGDSTPEGLPFLVMEYVDGVPIHEYCDMHHLSIEDRCRLMLPLCDAVHHAHRNLVVHRDIKPNNILVGTDGVAKLLDFGVAKALDPEQDGGPAKTTGFWRPCTPQYASPEQLAAGPITTATDIYLLGGVLFHILTGQAPHDASLTSERKVRRPSELAPTLRKLTGDLDNIVLRAMQPEPEGRYPSAEQFGEDLRRYLDGRPVAARAGSLVYRTRKLIRRNPWAAAATVLLLLAIASGVFATVHQSQIAEHRFNEVRRLARAVIFDIHDTVVPLPGSTQARKVIISHALQYLDNLSKEAPGDTSLVIELAEAYEKIGRVQGSPVGANLGDPAGGLASFQRAEQLLNSLPATELNQPKVVNRRVSILSELMILHNDQGRRAEAIAAFHKAREMGDAALRTSPQDRDLLATMFDLHQPFYDILQNSSDPSAADEIGKSCLQYATTLVQLDPASSAYKLNLANAKVIVAGTHRIQGNLSAAAAGFTEVLEIRKSLVASNPGNADFKRELILAYGHLADILGISSTGSLGDLDGAKGAMQEALAIAGELRRQDPSNRNAIRDLAQVRTRLGIAHFHLGAAAEALQEYYEVRNLASELTRENPHSMAHTFLSCQLEQHTARALAATGRTAEALAAFRRAITLADTLLARHPASPDFDYYRIFARLELAELLARSGQSDTAFPLALSLAKELPAKPPSFFFLYGRARFFGTLARTFHDIARSGSPVNRLPALRGAVDAFETSLEEWSGAAQKQPPAPFFRKEIAASEIALAACRRLLASVR